MKNYLSKYLGQKRERKVQTTGLLVHDLDDLPLAREEPECFKQEVEQNESDSVDDRIESEDEHISVEEKEEKREETNYRREGKIISREETLEFKKEQLKELNYTNLAKWSRGLYQMGAVEEKEKVSKDDLVFGDPLKKMKAAKKKESGNFENKFPPFPNRFGIKPGWRWDGRDRSNGFELKYISRQNLIEAHKDNQYKQATEDL